MQTHIRQVINLRESGSPVVPALASGHHGRAGLLVFRDGSGRDTGRA